MDKIQHWFMLSTHALLKRSYAYAMVRVWLKDNCCDINAQAHSAAYKHPLDYELFDTHHYNSMHELWQHDMLLARMLQRGLDINWHRDGWSPLNYCIRHGYNALVKLLIDHNDVDVNVRQQQNRLHPVLAAAAAYGNTQSAWAFDWHRRWHVWRHASRHRHGEIHLLRNNG